MLARFLIVGTGSSFLDVLFCSAQKANTVYVFDGEIQKVPSCMC